MSMSTCTVIYCFIIIGCIVFVDADETSKCYSVNGGNYCFYTNGSVMSWNEARQFCAGMNSTLPIIRDEDIDKVFQQFLVHDSNNVIQNNYVWIGARARPVNELTPWHWINGTQSAVTSSDLINHADNNWCATIGNHGGLSSLYTNDWTDKRHYVCQHDYASVQQFSSTTSSTPTVNCSPRWIVYPLSHGLSHRLHSASTLQQCLQACVDNSSCVSVDWHKGHCFIKYTREREPHNRATLYEIVRRCYSASDGICDDAFQLNSKCYKIHKEPVPWFTAVNRCLSNNATLAVFDDDVRQYFPNILLSEKSWIGLIKSWWTWTDSNGTDVLYNKFNVDSSSPPDNPPQHPNSNYNCVVDTTDGQWKVAQCDEQHLVVCQSDYYIQPEPTTEATTTTSTTTTSTSTSSASETDSDDDNTAAVAGGVVVAVVVIIIVVVVVVVVVLRRRRSRLSSDHQSQHHHRDADEDDKPTVADADYTELRNIGADNAAHVYSELNNVPTHNHLYANVSP